MLPSSMMATAIATTIQSPRSGVSGVDLCLSPALGVPGFDLGGEFVGSCGWLLPVLSQAGSHRFAECTDETLPVEEFCDMKAKLYLAGRDDGSVH